MCFLGVFLVIARQRVFLGELIFHARLEKKLEFPPCSRATNSLAAVVGRASVGIHVFHGRVLADKKFRGGKLQKPRHKP